MNKIYFISSYESNTQEQVYFTEDSGFNNYKREYEKLIKYDGKDFVISINSFSIIKDDLIKNKETDTYDLTVKLKVQGIFSYNIFKKSISFVEIKNHFIYGFKLEDDLPGIIYDGKAPKSIIFSKIEQLGLYIEFLNKVHSEPGDTLSNDFCEETIECLIKDKKFYFDFYLELLQYYKNTKNITKILDSFVPKNCEIPTNFNSSKYEPILEQIESNQEMYTKYCLEDGEDIKIKKKFYTLLIYFRLDNNEKEKLKNLINDENLLSLFAKIINQNEKFHQVVELAEDGLISEIMKQKKVSFDCIKKIIVTLNPVERLLSFIENNYDLILRKFRRIERSPTYTDFSALKGKETEKYGIIKKDKEREMTPQEYLCNFLEKEENAHHISHKKFQIILFNNANLDLYFKYKEVELFIINKSIYICLKNNKKFEEFKKRENAKIGNIKNKEFVQYLSNDISEYEKTNYGIYVYSENKKKDELFYFVRKKNDFEQEIKPFMPLNIFDRIELKTFGKKALRDWNKIKPKIFELKDIRYKLGTCSIIEEIQDLDEFDQFLNIIYSDKDFNYELSYEKQLISYLGDKFVSLSSKNKSHEYFTRIASNLIYKYDQLNLQPENFICDIEENINEYKTNKKYIFFTNKNKLESNKIINQFEINKIYEYLTNNYEITSNKLINHIADYIINQKNISLIKNLKNIKDKIIPVIFAKIDYCIEDTMVYDNLSINTYFILLEYMNKEGYSIYARNNIPNISKILKKLESGMVSYELMNSIYNSCSRKELFEKKISILLFNNESEILSLINIIKNYLNNINKNFSYLAELKEIIEKYYSWEDIFYRNISLINTCINRLKNGLLNEFSKAQTKGNLNKLNKIYVENNFHKKYIMKDSLVFKYENQILGNNRREIDKVFNNVSEKYNELAILFDKNWERKIKNGTIYAYCNIIKQTEENEKSSFEEKLKKDLQILSKYHCSYKNESEINQLRDEIKIHIDRLDIQSYLKGIKSYYESRNTSPNKEFNIFLKNIIECFNPEDNPDNGMLLSSLLLKYQLPEKTLSVIK